MMQALSTAKFWKNLMQSRETWWESIAPNYWKETCARYRACKTLVNFQVESTVTTVAILDEILKYDYSNKS